ncbi:MAG: hypothetical protein JOZ54_22090 [Acidobacteria bacterium]|nr:hypothetical protein [Acidobacteriota bacterium]
MRPLLACAAFLLAAAPALAGFEQTIPRGRVRRLVVDFPAGEVTVRNGAPDRITIAGKARRKNVEVDDAKLVLKVDGDEAVISRVGGSRLINYSVIVEVPPGIDVEVETRYGEVNLNGSFGDVDVDLRAGEVRLSTPRANVKQLAASVLVGEVHTNLGDRTIEREGVFPGTTRWENESGRSKVSVHTTAGEVHVTLLR